MKLSLLLAAFLLAALAAAFLLVRWDPEPDAIETRAEPVVVPVEQRTIDGTVPVNATLEIVAGREVFAPPWPGGATVIEAFVVAGSTLQTGAGVARIDGIVRVAAATPRPFHRALQFGDTGDDVAMLNALLLELGYLDALPATAAAYGFATDTAVAAWATDLGVRNSDGSFDAGWVVWLPESPFLVAESELATGRPAPTPGSVIARAPDRIASATLAAADATASLVFEPGVEYVFIARGERFGIDPESASVATVDLPRLAPLLTGGPAGLTGQQQPSLSGVVQRAVPLDVVAIPAAAVQSGAGGQVCAWVPLGDGYEARALVLAGSRSGITNVTSGLLPGESVLVNPADVLEVPACPSP